jgi:hypothetical protein
MSKFVKFYALILLIVLSISCNQSKKTNENVKDDNSVVQDDSIAMEDMSNIPEKEKDFIQKLTKELELIGQNNEIVDKCNERCRACRQQARYRLTSCLRSASNQSQINQCRSNYSNRVSNCNNKEVLDSLRVDEVIISVDDSEDYLLADALWEQANNWGLYKEHSYVGCGPGITPLLGSYQTYNQCSEAGRRRYENVPNVSWCCKKIRK